MAQNSIYDFTVKDNKGNDVSLAQYKGKVIARFEPTATKEVLAPAIEELIGE